MTPLEITCPVCDAPVGAPCRSRLDPDVDVTPHPARQRRAAHNLPDLTPKPNRPTEELK